MSSSHQHRTPLGRALVAAACASALLLGPVAGPASADDASLITTMLERSGQLEKREKPLRASISRLQEAPRLSRAKSAGRDAAAIYRTTVALRDDIREDDGSTDKGIAARDAVLPELTAMAAAAKKLDAQIAGTVRAGKVTKARVTKIVSAKLVLDRSIVKAVGAIADAISDAKPADPAPPPVDPAA